MNTNNTMNTRNTIEEAFNTIKGLFNKTHFYQSGDELYVGNNRVDPIYSSLVNAPISHFVSIRFKKDSYKNRYATELQRGFILKYLKYVNNGIYESFPGLISGKKSVRCIWKKEIGSSIKGHCHIHLLLMVDERVIGQILHRAEQLLYHLTDQFPGIIESYKIDPIKDKEMQISYFCKIDPKIGPFYDFLYGSSKVIERYYPNALKPHFNIPKLSADSEDYRDSILNQTDEIKDVPELTKAA